MKIIQNKKIQGAVFIFIIGCILCVFYVKENGGRLLTREGYMIEVKDLVKQENGKQRQWNLLLDDVQGTLLENPKGTNLQAIAFEDTCNQVYIEKITILGQSFIDIEKEFLALDIEGNKETSIPEYQQYVNYFEIFRLIGEQLQQFASVIEVGDYTTAIKCLEQLQELNTKIPVIE